MTILKVTARSMSAYPLNDCLHLCNCRNPTTNGYRVVSQRFSVPRRLEMSKNPTNQDASNILSNVPKEKAFFFCTAEGVYTKVSAISLQDFAAKLEDIDDSSILFHYPRGDFQAWIRDTVKDNVLAGRMCFIERGISGEKLRQELLKMVQTRISELKDTKQEVFPPSQCNKDGLCLS